MNVIFHKKSLMIKVSLFALSVGFVLGMSGWSLNSYRVDYLAKKLASAPPSHRYGIVKQLTELTEAPQVLEIVRDSGLPRDGELHLLTHVVGESLYRKKGAGALPECFSDDLYGCSHGLIISAMTSEGYDVIKNMIDACETEEVEFNYHMCLHAAGHGFLAYTKYEIQPALDYCDNLGVNGPEIQHCYIGVFMENVHGEHDNLAPISHPSLSRDNPFAPCDSIATKYQSACYLNQLGWWLTINGGNYTKVGSMCSEIPELYKRECANNFGRVMATGLQNNPKQIMINCENLEEPIIKYCIVGMAGAYSVVGANSLAIDFCLSSQTEERKRYCLQEMMKVWEVQAKLGNDVCVLFPDQYRDICSGTKL